MAMKSGIALLILLYLFLSSGISAEETHKKVNINELPEFTLPEITVTGNDSMHSLKMEVIRAEELKFDIFNSLNSTDEYDITCGWHSPVGTRIKEWSCDVGYLKNAGADDARDFTSTVQNLSKNNNPGSVKPVFPSRQKREIELAWKKRALNKEMIALAAEHPELAIAMVKANAMKQFYEAEGRKRYKKNILVGNSKPDEKEAILNEIDILEAAFMDHNRGVMSDEIWKRWDSMYRKIFNMKTYRIFWASAHKNKQYADEFVAYVNTIISGKRKH